MARWQQLTKYSVFRNMLINFVVLVALAVITVSSALYLFFAQKTEQAIASNVISSLNQTSYTSNVIQDQVLTIGNQLVNDHRIITVLMNKHPDPLDDRDAVNLLRSIQSIYPIIKYIGIYNNTSKRYLNTAGLPYDADEDVQKQFAQKKDSQYIDFFPQKHYAKDRDIWPDNVLTYVLRPSYSATSSYSEGAIVIHVDERYILETIRSIGGTSEDVFVLNENGIVLSHTNIDQFLHNFSEDPNIQVILNSNRESDYFIATVNGKKQLFTYVKSPQQKWIFVSVKPFDLLVSDISALRYFTWTVALSMIIIGFVLAYIAANRIYNPLGQLLAKVQSVSGKRTSGSIRRQNEYALLSEAFSSVIEQASSKELEVKHSLTVLKKTYLEHALKGTLHNLWSSNITIEELRDQFAAPYFTVILAKIDHYSTLNDKHSLQQLGLFRFAICNISQELLCTHGANDSIVIDEETVAILMQSDTAQLSASVFLTLGEIQHIIRNYFNLTITFSIGTSVDKQEHISSSYQLAQEYINYRLFFGHESIIHEELVLSRKLRNNGYPASAEKKLLEALNLNHVAKIDQAINQFSKEISSMTYYHTLSYANQLLITLMKEFDGTLHIMQQHSKECHDIINQLPNQETLSEIITCIKQFCEIITTLLEKKNSAKNRHIIEFVCQFLEENYYQSDLGVEVMADKVQLSSSYLGKLFKAHTQMSFNDYLRNIRLETAKQLLLNTDESVISISEKVGIASSNYFFSLFKKKYGISPSQYREQHNKRTSGQD